MTNKANVLERSQTLRQMVNDSQFHSWPLNILLLSGNQSRYNQRYPSSSSGAMHDHDRRNNRHEEVSNHGSSKGRKKLSSVSLSRRIYSSGSSIGPGDHVFQRWMTSRDKGVSIWSQRDYQIPLFSYLCKKHGGNCDKRRLWESIIRGSDHLDDLDVLYYAIQRIEQMFGLSSSLKWLFNLLFFPWWSR